MRAARIDGVAAADMKPLMDAWIGKGCALMTDTYPAYRRIGAAYGGYYSIRHGTRQFAVSTTGGHINTAEALSLVIEQARAGEALLIDTFARVHLRQPLSLTGNCSVTMKVSAFEGTSIRC